MVLAVLIRKARELNHNVSGYVMAPRTLIEYKLLETATEEVPKPNPFADIPMVETNQVSITQTQGTGTNVSSVSAGDFKNNVWAGWRYGTADSPEVYSRSYYAD